ncbi:MAG: hypothetical protein SXG53_16025 [Pseudomonadota bacterium]|nr:hypothetical protein [Pseudomonadota bacterium]
MISTARSVASGLLLLTATACGPLQADTPEPGESETIKELARKLGYAPSWSDKILAKATGRQTERADGAVLYDWLRRREATLGGKLEVYQTPALENPGKVADTLAWERLAQQADQQTREDIGSYRDMVSRMLSDCPSVTRQEDSWFSQYVETHAQGKHAAEVNWSLRALNLTLPCDQEKNGIYLETPLGNSSESAPDSNEPFTAAEQELIRRHDDAEASCRGSRDEQESERGCRDREVLLRALNAKGICWGKEDESYAEYAVHRCAPGSIGFGF